MTIIGAAARYYYESRHDGSLTNTDRVEIPTAWAAFPKEIMFNPPLTHTCPAWH